MKILAAILLWSVTSLYTLPNKFFIVSGRIVEIIEITKTGFQYFITSSKKEVILTVIIIILY